MKTGTYTEFEGGTFQERNLSQEETASMKFGREPGKMLAGLHAPDALIVRTVPKGYVYADDLARDLFGEDIALNHIGRAPNKYVSRLYTFAKHGLLETVVLYPHMKRYYRVLDMDRLRAEVTVKFLTKKYS